MIRPAAHTGFTTTLLRFGASLSATAALLAGCATAAGGTNGGGTVFSMSPDGKQKVLHSFDYPYSNPRKAAMDPKEA
jgi:uncharacterized repeat protein (TIGR03803 family)